jgi:hypothetical protein
MTRWILTHIHWDVTHNPDVNLWRNEYWECYVANTNVSCIHKKEKRHIDICNKMNYHIGKNLILIYLRYIVCVPDFPEGSHCPSEFPCNFFSIFMKVKSKSKAVPVHAM